MFSIIRRIIRWSGAYRKRIYIGFLLSFITGIFIAMPLMLAAIALDAILSDMAGIAPVTGRMVLAFLGLMVFSVVGRFVFSYLKARIQDTVVYERLADERIELGDILKRVPLGFFSENQTGDILAAVTSDLSFMELHAMTMLDMVVNGYITSAVMIICCTMMDWRIGLIVAAGILLSGIFLHLMGVSSRKNAKVLQKTNEDMTGTAIEYLRGMALVKTFHQEGVTTRGLHEAFRKNRDINIRIEKEYAVFNFLHMLSLKAATVAMVVYSAVMTMKGMMAIPEMVFCFIMSFMVYASAENLSSAFHVLNVIDHTLDKLDRLTNSAFIDEDGKDIEPEDMDIEFEHVDFSYDIRPILKDVTCSFPAGSFTAIVGPSGSGKTTMCSLIARFYDVDSGRITLGGRDLREYTCDSILKRISIVFQNVYLFHDTILENIRFGRPNATREEVIEAARRARCHEFISSMKDGYDTVVGEGGSSLSGGERQRISIARAILKDAPIIILDEATSSVDPENEHLIQEAISELVEGKTVIAIAHRLPTIESADQILVLEDGRIVQRGRHDELVGEDGLYRKFVEIRKRAENWRLCCDKA